MENSSSNIVFHALSDQETASAVKTDLNAGLSIAEVKERLKQYGSNVIAEKGKKSAIAIFLSQFKSPIVLLLLFAAALSFWFKEWLDGITILCVIVINAIIGFYMEFQAERSMQVLKKMSTAVAKVIRNGRLSEIDSDNIVPGDIVFVEAGDLVLADGRVFNLSQLQADESALTGESVPVDKQLQPIAAATTLAERNNMLYKGTYISKGNGYMIITATGMNTELGKVARLVQSADQVATPLEKKLEDFSKKLIRVTVGLVIIIFITGLIYGQKIFEMLETSIALAVAAVPEGLPIVATMALAQGMIKMTKHHVIVKKLSAVETLGGTNVICTDKTGTLTKNRIEVSQVFPTSQSAEDIIQETCILCNTAELYEQDGKLRELGDPLEIGLLKYARSKGLNIEQIRSQHPKIKEEPFSSETKVMATLNKNQSRYIVYVKGAAEELLTSCDRIYDVAGEKPLDLETRKIWLNKAEQLASGGLRIIGTAFKNTTVDDDRLTNNLVFTGLIGMIDPPREEVLAAIRECRTAGINVIMITGDHPATAWNIAHQLHIVEESDSKVILGKEMKSFDQLSSAEKDQWADCHVFARVSPKQKLDLIRVLQERKYVVGMTGDGINDAPALKKADIGIAMGLRGTQVAQEVADMILKDDAFSSIVLAIKQGRIIFANIQKFVVFLLSCNLSELFVISIASVFNLHFQLFPLQILFINLITDVLPALALGVTEGSPGIMKQLPRVASEPIIDTQRWKAIGVYSVIIAMVSIGAVLWSHYTMHRTERWNAGLCNNILFFTLIFSQLLHVLNMGSSGVSFYKSEVFRNRYIWYSIIASLLILFGLYTLQPVRAVLSIHSMSLADWSVCFISAIAGFLIIQIAKNLKLIRQ